MLHVNDFQTINGRFSNKASLQCKETLFALKRSLLLRTKKPCLKTGGISLLSTCNPYTVPVLYITMITNDPWCTSGVLPRRSTPDKQLHNMLIYSVKNITSCKRCTCVLFFKKTKRRYLMTDFGFKTSRILQIQTIKVLD